MIRGGMTVTVRGWDGMAWNVLQRKGRRVWVAMVGDDRVREVRAEDCTALSSEKYCKACGQIGCSHS